MGDLPRPSDAREDRKVYSFGAKMLRVLTLSRRERE